MGKPCHAPPRWIKFEEKVEKGGERWSKPHVATLSLHSLFELKTCIEKGTILLDLEASTLPQVVGKTSTLPISLSISLHQDMQKHHCLTVALLELERSKTVHFETKCPQY